MLHLHPHHGLCALHFQEHGYDDLFTAHMSLLLTGLSVQNPPVALTPEPDLICLACPHNTAAGCETAAKVRRYDEAVLALCGLRAGDTLPWQEFLQLCREKIVDPGRMEQVCGDCSWAALCKEIGDARFRQTKAALPR